MQANLTEDMLLELSLRLESAPWTSNDRSVKIDDGFSGPDWRKVAGLEGLVSSTLQVSCYQVANDENYQL